MLNSNQVPLLSYLLTESDLCYWKKRLLNTEKSESFVPLKLEDVLDAPALQDCASLFLVIHNHSKITTSILPHRGHCFKYLKILYVTANISPVRVCEGSSPPGGRALPGAPKKMAPHDFHALPFSRLRI